jgi:nucleotide-binding universal stress UspA family protein
VLHHLSADTFSGFELLVGNAHKALKAFAEEWQVDMVLSGADWVSGAKGMSKNTAASALMKEIHLPYFTIKCERDGHKIRKIGLIRDYLKPAKESLEAIKKLQHSLDATFYLVHIADNPSKVNEEEVKKAAKEFAEKHQLDHVDFHLLFNKDKKEAVEELITGKELDLLVMEKDSMKVKKTIGRTDYAKKVLNQVAHPLVIY